MPTRADLAKIHIAKKELGLTDDEYRDILRAKFGKESAAKLTPGQAFSLINHFVSRGWRPKHQQKLPGMYSRPTDPQERKIVAMWITLHKAGVVRNGSDSALQAFVSRVTGVDSMRWCTTYQKHAVIEALKAWGDREGVDFD